MILFCPQFGLDTNANLPPKFHPQNNDVHVLVTDTRGLFDLCTQHQGGERQSYTRPLMQQNSNERSSAVMITPADAWRKCLWTADERSRRCTERWDHRRTKKEKRKTDRQKSFSKVCCIAAGRRQGDRDDGQQLGFLNNLNIVQDVFFFFMGTKQAVREQSWNWAQSRFYALN